MLENKFRWRKDLNVREAHHRRKELSKNLSTLRLRNVYLDPESIKN